MNVPRKELFMTQTVAFHAVGVKHFSGVDILSDKVPISRVDDFGGETLVFLLEEGASMIACGVPLHVAGDTEEGLRIVVFVGACTVVMIHLPADVAPVVYLLAVLGEVVCIVFMALETVFWIW